MAGAMRAVPLRLYNSEHADPSPDQGIPTSLDKFLKHAI
ncbi:hypothetical protein HYPGJ_20107 [Hyphomicrobium sp. GJ21]|nr:hypothetical protein HYPGJ_20107 [Hyphomicrobium sp. GJ21]